MKVNQLNLTLIKIDDKCSAIASKDTAVVARSKTLVQTRLTDGRISTIDALAASHPTT